MSTAASTQQDLTAAVRALDSEFARLANAGDAASLTDHFYAEDATLLPPGAPAMKGKAAIREFWAGFISALQPSEAALEATLVEGSGELVYSTGAYGFTSGGVRHTGKYLVVLRRQPDGSLKCVADAFGPNE